MTIRDFALRFWGPIDEETKRMTSKGIIHRVRDGFGDFVIIDGFTVNDVVDFIDNERND